MPVNSVMAARAIRMFPMLGRLNVVRMWSGIRVMTRDGFPIYDQSETLSRRVLVVLPYRRDARGQPRADPRAHDRQGPPRSELVGAFQRQEVRCLRRLPETGAQDASRSRSTGKRVTARAGDTVAAALLAAGFDHCRTTPISGAPRAPYCMMGVCFDCLVTIDGIGNRQGCLVQVREGMASSFSAASGTRSRNDLTV